MGLELKQYIENFAEFPGHLMHFSREHNVLLGFFRIQE